MSTNTTSSLFPFDTSSHVLKFIPLCDLARVQFDLRTPPQDPAYPLLTSILEERVQRLRPPFQHIATMVCQLTRTFPSQMTQTDPLTPSRSVIKIPALKSRIFEKNIPALISSRPSKDLFVAGKGPWLEWTPSDNAPPIILMQDNKRMIFHTASSLLQSLDSFVQIWDRETGSLLQTLPYHESIQSIGITDDGMHLVIRFYAHQEFYNLYDLATLPRSKQKEVLNKTFELLKEATSAHLQSKTTTKDPSDL